MSLQILFKNGTTEDNLEFTGAPNELTVDTDQNMLRLHDGATEGGHLIPPDHTDECTTRVEALEAQGTPVPRPRQPKIIQPSSITAQYQPLLKGDYYWCTIPHDASYWIVATDEALTNRIVDEGWTTTALEELNLATLGVTLTPDTTYYAAVAYRNTDGYASFFSESRLFRTASLYPETPSIIKPEPGGELYPEDIIKTGYYICHFPHADTRWIIATDAALSSVVVDTGWDSESLTELLLDTLAYSFTLQSTYYVAAQYRTVNGDVSEQSDSVAFVYTAPRPDTPIITFPTLNQPTISQPKIKATAYNCNGVYAHHYWEPPIEYDIAHEASRWIVAKDDTLSTIVHDTGWTATALEELDLNTAGVTLDDQTTHYSAVSYRNIDLVESTQSPVVSFYPDSTYMPTRVVQWGSISEEIPLEAQTDIQKIACGQHHALAITNDGKVIAWGTNSRGQCTVPVEAQSGIIDISAGKEFSLALKDTGEVIAWGYNNENQCTVPVEAQSGIVKVVAGNEHALAIKNTGRVYGWGDSGYGILSIPTTAHSGIISVDASRLHSVALKDTGEVIAWGYSNRLPATGDTVTNIAEIATCGAGTFNLDNNGQVWYASNYDYLNVGTIPANAQSGVVKIRSYGSGYFGVAVKDTHELVFWGGGASNVDDSPAEVSSSKMIDVQFGINFGVAIISDL